MGIKEAVIYLDNPYNTYYAGQTVNGRIEYKFDSPKKVRGIHVKFKGEAHTEWYESKQEEDSQGKTQSTDTLHTANEEYFQNSYYLLGNKQDGEIEIPTGDQVYNFTCTLPPVLPSSFEGEHGYVRYTVKVTLERPWKFDQETKMAFTVINALDLNLNPNYREPIHFQLEKTFCCFCCASAPLSVDVRAPVSGYCPGQVIPLQIDIENKSNVQLHLLKIFLRKIVTYRATSPNAATKKSKEVIITLQEGPAPAGTTKNWNLNLQIPPMPPSNLINCNIIDLDYDLKVECVVSGMHMNLKDRKYVTIGTVPLMGATPSAPPAPTDVITQNDGQPAPAILPVTSGLPAQPSHVAGDAGWVAPGGIPTQPPFQTLYPTLSQPVYKESAYTARTIQDRNDSNYTRISGTSNFAPYYPTYSGILPPPLPQ